VTAADETSDNKDQRSCNQPLDKKDTIIAQQAETIKTLTQTIKALS
jgi:hypothetical protein